MPCRSRGFAVSGTATAREIIDRLYALPFDEFTWERNQAERELRRAGQREQAEQAKTVRKPTAAAAAANHLVRAHRAQVETSYRRHRHCATPKWQAEVTSPGPPKPSERS